MNILKEKNFLLLIIDKIKSENILDTGAMLAYYMLFSLFPLLIFILNITAMVASGYQALILNYIQVFPDNIIAILEPSIISIIKSSSSTLLSFSLLLSLWSGSNGVIKLMNEVSKAFKSRAKRGFITERLMGIFFTIAFGAIMIILLLSNVFGRQIYLKITSILGPSKGFDTIWTVATQVFPFFIMIVVFTLLYRFSPQKDIKKKLTYQEVLIGAVFTSLVWTCITYVFSFFVNTFSSFDKTYGSLAGIIALLLWLYLSSITVILGAYLAAVIWEGKEMDKRKKTINYSIKKIKAENSEN